MNRLLRLPSWIFMGLLLILILAFSGCASPSTPQGIPEDGGSPLVFSAQDLDGNPVDESIFAGHPVTFVHRWATWCGPCVNEMDTLAELIEACQGQDVGFLFMVEDGDTDSDGARTILEDAGIREVCIVETAAVDALFGHSYYPATVLVDRDGKKVGNGLIGAQPVRVYRSAIDGAMAED